MGLKSEILRQFKLFVVSYYGNQLGHVKFAWIVGAEGGKKVRRRK